MYQLVDVPIFTVIPNSQYIAEPLEGLTGRIEYRGLGNFSTRLAASLTAFILHAERLHLSSQIVVVDYNPPPHTPSLRQQMLWQVVATIDICMCVRVSVCVCVCVCMLVQCVCVYTMHLTFVTL